MLPYVSNFPLFGVYILAACPSAANILLAQLSVVTASKEHHTSDKAAIFYPTLDKQTSEASCYQALCVSFLSAPAIIEWCHPNPNLRRPSLSALEPTLPRWANKIYLGSSAQSATDYGETFPTPPAIIFELHASMAALPGNISALVLDLLQVSVSILTSSFKTRPFATASFRDFL